MPPALLRRPVTVAVWLVLSLLTLLLSPLLLLIGAVGAAIIGRPQPNLVARAMIAYFAGELVVLVAAGALWLASGLGRFQHTRAFQRLHLRLLGWFVRAGARRLTTLLDLHVRPEPSPEAAAALQADRPLLFFSRHAGPGDTLLLVDELMTRYGRAPSVVFKELLVLDPGVDLLAHRLPHAVLDTSKGEECAARIAQVSAELPPRGVLVLFPEGGNFTPQRRRRALSSLRRRGRLRQARAGESMTHVMPPHPSGALAALRGNPDADVLFSAHTGLGLATFARELWHEVPIGRTFTNRIWLAPAAERPEDPVAQERWLYSWWRRIDEWVDAQGEAVPPPPPS
jgi:1-acyl-sn-glycerol-3-phosphate acyltransferase